MKTFNPGDVVEICVDGKREFRPGDLAFICHIDPKREFRYGVLGLDWLKNGYTIPDEYIRGEGLPRYSETELNLYEAFSLQTEEPSANV